MEVHPKVVCYPLPSHWQHFFLAFISLILFRTSQVSSVRVLIHIIQLLRSDSWKELEEEVACLFFVTGVRVSSDNSDETRKVSLSLVLGVLVAFSTSGGLGKVWSGDIWLAVFNISKESIPWVFFLFINMFCWISS